VKNGRALYEGVEYIRQGNKYERKEKTVLLLVDRLVILFVSCSLNKN